MRKACMGQRLRGCSGLRFDLARVLSDPGDYQSVCTYSTCSATVREDRAAISDSTMLLLDERPFLDPCELARTGDGRCLVATLFSTTSKRAELMLAMSCGRLSPVMATNVVDRRARR